MKPADKKDPGGRLVRQALVNIFLFPGLGSVRAGRRLAGAGQIIILLAGSLLMFVWLYKILDEYYRLMFEDVKVENVGWIGITGGALIVVAWLWSVVTSLGMFAEASRLSAAQPMPPALTKSDASKRPDPRFANELATVPQWQYQGRVISRTYTFKDFLTAMSFVNGIAHIAEEAQHHPDVDIRWNKVTLALTTHDAGGLTAKDFALARQCDQLSVRD